MNNKNLGKSVGGGEFGKKLFVQTWRLVGGMVWRVRLVSPAGLGKYRKHAFLMVCPRNNSLQNKNHLFLSKINYGLSRKTVAVMHGSFTYTGMHLLPID